MNSWSKMILNHINHDVNIYHDSKLVCENVRIINIDVDNMIIIYRKERGEGVQGMITGGSIRIEDTQNYRPGRTEYEKMHGIERSPEELVRGY